MERHALPVSTVLYRQSVLDYDDLLLYWAQTVSDPALAADIGGRFDHVLVDVPLLPADVLWAAVKAAAKL